MRATPVGRRAPRRNLTMTAVAATIVAAGTGCGPEIYTPTPPPRPAGAHLYVDVIGDSLIRQSEPNLSVRLDLFGFGGHRITGIPGQAMTSPEITAAIDAVRSQRRDIVVIATSTNDAVTQSNNAYAYGQGAAEERSHLALRSVLSSFSDRCVVLVTAKENVLITYQPHQAVAYNHVLRSEASSHLNTVVVDWATDPATQSSELFEPDQLHFGPDPAVAAQTRGGADAYANAITGGVARCRQMLQPGT